MRLGYSYINSATTERQVRYVYRFVELVLSKTSKIVVKSSKAKAMFMMNEPVADLVVDFFNKIKVTYSATKKILEIKIPSTSDLPDELHRLPLSASSSSLSGTKSLKFPENVPSKLSAVVAHVKKLYSICQSVENIALGFEQKTDPRCYDYTGSVTYPIVVSSNVNLDTFVPPSLSKKLLSAFSKPITSTSLSASNSTFTVNGHHSSYKPEIPSFPHKAVSLSNINGARSIVDKESDKRYNYCHIPKIGWCIAHSLPPNLSSVDDDRYLFTILFNDGSRLQVDSATDIIVYHDPDNHCTTAKMGLELPSFMKSRLKQLPLFLNVLGF
ncbi:Serine/threonine-protein kinase PLK4 [Zancudomyces culisetae]|uniref:Serine/threonine-protein kinase PLK4 n=1 Tax=Zancudomyces culisetae TaxID=1213189 RepID=A0A1R1PR77_ZANCU|nr:Serine/threonine-protein kinase PLK4 [Zancudomyces culisetae]|eukprot:OMH83449.1 Serine/threonine-protein kinase PLK4 [Zancudomyces culisetae]